MVGQGIREHRSIGLDLLRAVAILLVFYSHSSTFFLANGLGNTVAFARAYGHLPDGVSLFFVLSGFLIGRGLIVELESRKAAWPLLRMFFFRRIMRTFPQYFLVLSVITLVYVALGGGVPPLSYWFFLQNLNWPMAPWFPESWSLAVEEWFYVFLPVLALPLSRIMGVRLSILLVSMLFIAGSAIHRHEVIASFPSMSVPEWDLLIRKQVLTRLDALAYGVLAAYAHVYHRPAWNRWRHACLAAGLGLFAYHLGIDPQFPDGKVGFSMLTECVACMLLLPFLSEMVINNRLVALPIQIISKTSYTIYLIHLTLVQFIVIHHMRIKLLWRIESDLNRAIFEIALYVVLTIAMTFALYKYFDRPIMALRERISSRC